MAKKFSELKEYKKENGNVDPTTRHGALRKWCYKQRNFYKKDTLSQRRCDLLDNIGFNWDPIETEWQNKFSVLKEFTNKNENKSPNRKNNALEKWCLTQQMKQKKGKLSLERFELLNNIGFTWN